MKSQAATNSDLQEIIHRLEEGGSFDASEVKEYKKDPGIIPGLIRSVHDRSADYRLEATRLLRELGCPQYQPLVAWPPHLAPYVSDSSVVAHLVAMLGDEDEDVRNFACKTLVEEVPDPLIRNHTADIIMHLRHHPGTYRASLLLGKTGAEAAIREIQSNSAIREADPEEACLALARLGNRQQEDFFIQAYKKTSDPSELEEAAHRLGYIGTLRAALTLAQDVRNPAVYIWHEPLAKRSVRVHIIEGLHMVFLTEPIFFRPVRRPEDDSYYEAIENWITQNLGVTWDKPRPPFLYTEDAPIPP